MMYTHRALVKAMLNEMEVIGVGIATVDVIYEVDAYPQEDAKIRALSQRKARGGNATNALVVASQLGAICRWMGTWTNPLIDSDAAFVQNDLNNASIDSTYVTILPHGAMPVSFIISSQSNGSRTIVHHRNLEELTYQQFCTQVDQLIAVDTTKRYWFHFEGRNLTNVLAMMKYLHLQMKTNPHQFQISLEVEARRNEWDEVKCMLLYTDVVFFSKDYIQNKLQYTSFHTFIEWFMMQNIKESNLYAIIAPWGSDGAYYTNLTKGVSSSEYTIQHVPVFHQIENVIDSVGAGDTFIGAALVAFSKSVHDWRTNSSLMSIVSFACRVATEKCHVMGLQLPSEVVVAMKQMLENLEMQVIRKS